ncbi:hypothetical protein ACHAWF_007490 [Thalassiosira exigua]
MPSYYDVEAILAEEELLTVKPAFAFAHLVHLDPDARRPVAAVGRKRRRDESGGGGGGGGGGSALPEGTKVKMPLWAVDRWAMLGFVKIPTLPRHYRQRTKERLMADPVDMNLCLSNPRSHKSERYFLAGTILVNLLLRAARVARRHTSSSARASAAASARLLAADRMSDEARSLRRSLLSSMMGARLCRNFDWTLGALDAMEDDVSEWTKRLSALELGMFRRGVEASGAARAWREHGCGRVGVSAAAIVGVRSTKAATPGGSGREGKQRVVTPVGGGRTGSF